MAITKVELANMLLGVESTKKAAAKIKTSTIVGTAHNDSHDGYVLVDLGGDVISVDGKQYVSLATTSDVRAGDKVYVMLRGADGTAMGATVIGAAGGGDRTKGDIAEAKTIAQNAETKVNAVKAESDAHESQIDAIQQDIAAYKANAEATYATKTEVDEKTGAISKTIEADYTKTADLASTDAVRDAKAAGTAAQASIDGMKLGGRNLLSGTSMDVVTGTYPSSSYIDYLSYGTIDVADGDTYTLSFDAKSTHAGDIIICYFYSPNTTLTGISSTGMKFDSGKYPDGYLQVKLTDGWQRYWCTWTQSATTKQKLVIPFRCFAGQGSGTVSMRGVKLEAGNKATDWTPAPEDTDSAVADAKAAGTGASAALDSYKGVVSETYAEKTELTEAVNQLSSTMSSNYSAFTTYRTSNDTALSKAQTDATNAQSTIDSYKTSNDKAVADAKAAGTTAQSQLSSYRSSNDAAVAAAKKAGTDAQSDLDAYRGTTDQRLDELKNIADNAIETWYLKGVPTASNAPAKDWTTDALKKRHAGDLYMDTDTGYSYRWSGTEWVQVKDSDVTKALKEIESVKTTYATKSELKATDTELSGKVSDALTTAKSYTDGSVEKEATARDAAIKAQADSISLSVSKTYTKYETFSSYQEDADGRIATANANASTAVSTAKTAASDAATAKTNASTAVSTANSASTSAANAVKTANSASTSAASAVKTANSASSTASAASTTASKASTDAAAAVKTANTASYNASTAVTTANGAVSTANTASSTASAAKTTAEGAASTASSAKSVADSANLTAKTASTNASNAVSTANAANSTAQTAKSTADTAKSTAETAKDTADDAYSRTLRVQVSSAPADAAGDTSTLTATVWRGGQQLTEQEVAMMGLVAWYVGGKRVATGSTYTCAAGTAAECRLEA